MIKRNQKIIYSILIIVIITLVFLLWHSKIDNNKGGDAISTISTHTYIYPPTGLAFSYDSGYQAKLLTDKGVDTIVVQKNNSSDDGFQIVISSWDEPAQDLTFTKIATDVPDMSIRNPQNITPSFGPALSFESGNATSGTREIWFVYRKYFYQMSAPITSANLVDQALNSIIFK